MITGSWEITAEKTDWREAVLYQARHLETGREYLLEDLALATEVRDRIYREIALGIEECMAQAASVPHPAVRCPLGVTKHQDRFYLVREWDQALWEGWGEKPVPRDLAELGQWLELLASILTAYHVLSLTTRGIAHTDLVRTAGGLLVLDPICESYLAAYRPKERFFRYDIAPENIKKHEWTAASDVFVLGINAYELTTGRLPFGGDGAVFFDNLLAEKILDPRRYQPLLGPSPAKSILSMLARETKDRPNASDLAATFTALAGGGCWVATGREQAEFSRIGMRHAGFIAFREKILGFIRRNRVLSGVSALAIVVVALMVVFRGRPTPVITSAYKPWQVATAYYRAIATLDQPLLAETLKRGVGKRMNDMVTNLMMLDKISQAYAMQGAIPRGGPILQLLNLEVKRISQTPVVFQASYTIIINKGGEDQIELHSERLTLERLPDKLVGEKWEITKIDSRVLNQRIISHKTAPDANQTQFAETSAGTK